MGGVKAGVGIRVQNAGCWYPLFEDRSELLPLLPCALTTTYQYVTPQSIDASLEDAQLIDVAGDSMVLVVAGDHTPKRAEASANIAHLSFQRIQDVSTKQPGLVLKQEVDVAQAHDLEAA